MTSRIKDADKTESDRLGALFMISLELKGEHGVHVEVPVSLPIRSSRKQTPGNPTRKGSTYSIENA